MDRTLLSFSLVMALVLVLGFLAISDSDESSAEEVTTVTIDDYVYEVSADGHEAKVIGYNGNETSLVIPEVLPGGTTVTSIEKDVFRETDIRSVVLPDGVKTIGIHAFFKCRSLETVVFGSDLKKIEKGAFSRTGLREVKIHSKDVKIGIEAFRYCNNLERIDIPCVKDLEKDAFRGTPAKEIVVPISVDYVAHMWFPAFRNCKCIEKVTLTPGTGHGFDYFDSCWHYTSDYKKCPWGYSKNSFKTLIVSEGIKSIGKHTFKNCLALSDVTLPDGLMVIGHSAFEGCKSLKNLKIPDSVTEVGKAAFKNCTGLTQLTVPVSLNTVFEKKDPAFDGCKNIEKVTLTKGTGNGYDYADHKHTPWHISRDSFKYLTIQDGVKSIGKKTFMGCDNLQSIQFCTSLESVGENAFKGLNFFDKDGTTALSQNAVDLAGCTFCRVDDRMIKT